MNTPSSTSAYAGQQAVLATKHGKLTCIAPAFTHGRLAVEAVAVDTDALGTFTGEIPRTAPPLEIAVAKARLGMAETGNPIGVASEGSIGAHPVVPWIIVDREIVVLVDDRRGSVVAGVAVSADATTIAKTVRPGDDLHHLLDNADLPAHALIVMRNAGLLHRVQKGLRCLSDIAAAVEICAASSADGAAQIQTDLRAHVCPSRRSVMLTEVGPVPTDVPRDRDASFEPQLVKNRQRQLYGVDEMVISLTAKELTAGEVQAHLAEVYGTNVSRETISKVTDARLSNGQ